MTITSRDKIINKQICRCKSTIKYLKITISTIQNDNGIFTRAPVIISVNCCIPMQEKFKCKVIYFYWCNKIPGFINLFRGKDWLTVWSFQSLTTQQCCFGKLWWHSMSPGACGTWEEACSNYSLELKGEKRERDGVWLYSSFQENVLLMPEVFATTSQTLSTRTSEEHCRFKFWQEWISTNYAN